jgi:integrase
MASAYIVKRSWADKKGRQQTRYRVLYRLGGRETPPTYYGSFETRKEAEKRRDVVAGMLAAGVTPPMLKDLLTPPEARPVRTVREVAEKWRRSRTDVADGTATTHSVNINRILRVLGDRDVDRLEPVDVAELVAELHSAGLKRESIRKTRSTLAMILDFAGRKGDSNPARDSAVKLPREEPEEPNPPPAAHVEAVARLLGYPYRLALCFLDHSGARVGALDGVLVSDYDERERRIRLRAATTKTRRALWIDLPDVLADAIEEQLGPREDRDPAQRLFAGVESSDAFRTALGRACKAAGVPHFHPHDLRHRRISLLHAQGVSWARIGELVGQRNLATTANIYTHVLIDETELDYANVLRRDRQVSTPVVPELV